ncbi:MAG: hypothetical protein WBA65_00140 [Rhodanobacter sp.]|jgi:hypothetical protein
MNDKRSGSLSNRRLLLLLGGSALVLGIVLVGAGAGFGHAGVFWGGVCSLLTGAVWLVCARRASEEPMRPAQRGYVREFLPAMAAYMVLLFASQILLRHLQAVPLRVLVVLLPIVPIVFVVRAMVRLVLASDELERRLQLEAISIASMSVGLLSFAAAFLRGAGLLPVDNALMLVLPALFAAYGIASWWVRRRFRDE